MTLKQFLTSMLSDAESGGISSKRVIGTVAFIVYISLIYINTYTNYKTPDVFVDSLMYIILGVFLTSTLEYFSKRSPISSTTVKTGDNTDVVVTQTQAAPENKQQPLSSAEDNEKIEKVSLVDKNIKE